MRGINKSPTFMNYRFSLILPLDGKHWMVRDSANRAYDDNVDAGRVIDLARCIVTDMRNIEQRKRVTLWVRDKAAAAQHMVGRVVWAGKSKGPGFDAYRAGTYSIDALLDVVVFHIRMMDE
jgi:hypothetical protein